MTDPDFPTCVILAGGRGTRISEESHLRPKPMIEIGGKPILWHIMKIYEKFNVRDFVICLGYRGNIVKEYFINYSKLSSDITVDMASSDVEFHFRRGENWRVTLVDTGESTNTGGRIRRVRDYIDPAGPFFLTYGDGLANIDIAAELEFHRSHGRLVTMGVVRPPARFGTPVIEGDVVNAFLEKPQASEGYISGGFFVVQPDAIETIEGDDTSWEWGPLAHFASEDQLRAWHHDGFWHPMDTLRDKEFLNSLWDEDKAPWKSWM